MKIIKFTLPPLPYLIVSGQHTFQPGERHFDRRGIEIFDLLYVVKGTLYMAEEQCSYALRPGDTLILRPDCHHYGYQDCEEETVYEWLHFQTAGGWSASETSPDRSDFTPSRDEANQVDIRNFELYVPQHCRIPLTQKMEEKLAMLRELGPDAHISTVGLRQQILFQEVLQQLADSNEADAAFMPDICAEQAASYLRTHYREQVTAEALKAALNFHPVYIARCMKRKYGCSPMEYLQRYRIEQSKLLLMQSNYSISRIAEEVGFNQTPYFSSRFMRLEGLSPREYRRRFSQ